MPREEWVSLVVPHYPTGKRGRPPIEIETMLRMYLLQCWFSLSDEGVEDAIYDSYAMRKFMGINFFEQDVPDATTLLHFRHLLEEKGIGKLFFDAINRCLERAGRMMRGGSIVDATLISAPSSNADPILFVYCTRWRRISRHHQAFLRHKPGKTADTSFCQSDIQPSLYQRSFSI
nr:transposase [uncultured Oscillibacter sp.]